MDEQAYLEPDFDPATLTMPRLRSILVAHNVNYPSSAKKGQLVELFNENVRPQARQIRAANARVRRTSMGIENVPSSQSTVDGEEDEESEVPAPRSAAARGSRRSTRARTEEVDDVTITPRRSRHSTAPPEAPTPRRASSKHARPAAVQEEEEVEPEAKRRVATKSRVSAAASAVNGSRTRDDDTPFSNANVFQSGSSPPATAIRRTNWSDLTLTASVTTRFHTVRKSEKLSLFWPSPHIEAMTAGGCAKGLANVTGIST